MRKERNVGKGTCGKKEEKVPVKHVHGITALTQMKRVCQRQGYTVVRTDYDSFECYNREGELKQIVISTMR